MGSTYDFKCDDCNYAGTVAVGGTMSDFKTINYVPIICHECAKITSTSSNKNTICCNSCSSENVTLFGDETRSKKFMEDMLNKKNLKYNTIKSIRLKNAVDLNLKKIKNLKDEIKKQKIDKKDTRLNREKLQILLKINVTDLKFYCDPTFWGKSEEENSQQDIYDELNRKLNWYEGLHLCPKCKEYSLNFNFGLLFD